jgi:hypothetical protein
VDESVVAALASVDRLLGRLAWAGFERTSAESKAELTAVAQTAHAAGLIRLEREIAALATEIARYDQRDPLSNAGTTGRALHRVWALARRSQQAVDRGIGPDEDIALFGEARRTYREVVGIVEVTTLAAWGWVTDSGFVGVTARMAGADGREREVSTARPSEWFGKDPAALLYAGSAEGPSIGELLHGSFALSNVKESADGRLSLHRALQVAPAPWPGASAFAAWEAPDWARVLDRVAASEDGRAEVWVAAASSGEVAQDDRAGQVRQVLRDRTGAPMTAIVGMRPENNRWIDNLGALAKLPAERRPVGLFGRAWVGAGGLCFEPWTALWNREIGVRRRKVHELHLSLEALGRVDW